MLRHVCTAGGPEEFRVPCSTFIGMNSYKSGPLQGVRQCSLAKRNVFSSGTPQSFLLLIWSINALTMSSDVTQQPFVLCPTRLKWLHSWSSNVQPTASPTATSWCNALISLSRNPLSSIWDTSPPRLWLNSIMLIRVALHSWPYSFADALFSKSLDPSSVKGRVEGLLKRHSFKLVKAHRWDTCSDHFLSYKVLKACFNLNSSLSSATNALQCI